MVVFKCNKKGKKFNFLLFLIKFTFLLCQTKNKNLNYLKTNKKLRFAVFSFLLLFSFLFLLDHSFSLLGRKLLLRAIESIHQLCFFALN